MEVTAGEYTKLAIPTYAPRALGETAEGRFWRGFRAPKLLQQASRGSAAGLFLYLCKLTTVCRLAA